MAEEVTAENIVSEPVIEPAPAPEPVIPEPTSTAQPVEPLNPESEIELETTPSSSESSSVTTSKPAPIPTPEPISVIPPVSAPVIQGKQSLLAKARNIIQFRKRKKLDKIMSLYLKKQTITNDDVQKLLYVSDATATRYLQQLEKEGKIRRQGTPEHMSYSRM